MKKRVNVVYVFLILCICLTCQNVQLENPDFLIPKAFLHVVYVTYIF